MLAREVDCFDYRPRRVAVDIAYRRAFEFLAFVSERPGSTYPVRTMRTDEGKNHSEAFRYDPENDR